MGMITSSDTVDKADRPIDSIADSATNFEIAVNEFTGEIAHVDVIDGLGNAVVNIYTDKKAFMNSDPKQSIVIKPNQTLNDKYDAYTTELEKVKPNVSYKAVTDSLPVSLGADWKRAVLKL